MKNGKELWRAVKFLLFSASAGIIEIVSFALLNELTGWSYRPCYLIALVLSVLWNFTLNRRFTFRSANNVPVAMLKVAAYYAVFTPLSTMLGSWLADGLGWNDHGDQHGAQLRDGVPVRHVCGLPRHHRHQRSGEEKGKRKRTVSVHSPQAVDKASTA